MSAGPVRTGSSIVRGSTRAERSKSSRFRGIALTSVIGFTRRDLAELEGAKQLQASFVWDAQRWHYAMGMQDRMIACGPLTPLQRRPGRKISLTRFLKAMRPNEQRIEVATDGNYDAAFCTLNALISCADTGFFVTKFHRIPRGTVCRSLSVRKVYGKPVNPRDLVGAVNRKVGTDLRPALVGTAWAVALWHRAFHPEEYPDADDEEFDHEWDDGSDLDDDPAPHSGDRRQERGGVLRLVDRRLIESQVDNEEVVKIDKREIRRECRGDAKRENKMRARKDHGDLEADLRATRDRIQRAGREPSGGPDSVR